MCVNQISWYQVGICGLFFFSKIPQKNVLKKKPNFYLPPSSLPPTPVKKNSHLFYDNGHNWWTRIQPLPRLLRLPLLRQGAWSLPTNFFPKRTIPPSKREDPHPQLNLEGQISMRKQVISFKSKATPQRPQFIVPGGPWSVQICKIKQATEPLKGS